MPVYVDPELAWTPTPSWPWSSVSHLYADTEEELHAFARKIGLRRRWCSDHTQPNSRLLHYDLNSARRARAVTQGAVEVDRAHKRTYYRRKD